MSDELKIARVLLHDLRNPLAAAYTAVSMVTEMPANTTVGGIHRHLEVIEQAVERGRLLIDAAEERLDLLEMPADSEESP